MPKLEKLDVIQKLDCLLCAKCCEQTEMLLAKEDVDLIIKKTKILQKEFTFLKNGYFYLKNKGKYCVFLNEKSKKCSIYEFRPRGCRFYPVIYDPYLKKCVVDRDCTNKDRIQSISVKKLCPELVKFINKLEIERNRRISRHNN